MNVEFIKYAPSDQFKVFISVYDAETYYPIGSITQSNDDLYCVSIHRKKVPSHIELAPSHREHFVCNGHLVKRIGASTFKNFTTRYAFGSKEDVLDEIRKSVLNGNLVSCGEDSCYTLTLEDAKEMATYLANVIPDDLVFTQDEVDEIGFSDEQMDLYFGKYRIIDDNTNAKFAKIA